MLNLGKASKQWLAEIGVYSVQDIKKKGVVRTYLRVKAKFPEKVSLNMLWALQGATMGMRWSEIPKPIKERLHHEAEKEEKRAKDFSKIL